MQFNLSPRTQTSTRRQWTTNHCVVLAWHTSMTHRMSSWPSRTMPCIAHQSLWDCRRYSSRSETKKSWSTSHCAMLQGRRLSRNEILNVQGPVFPRRPENSTGLRHRLRTQHCSRASQTGDPVLMWRCNCSQAAQLHRQKYHIIMITSK